MDKISVTHVIFDVDGLLLDTEVLYTKAMNVLCSKYGKEFTWNIKVQMMGKKETEAGKIIIKCLDLPITVEQYVEQVHKLQDEMFTQAELLPGAEKLVRHLHKKGIPIAVATGSDKHGYELKTSQHTELFQLFNHTVLSGSDPDVKNGKPAPDCFLVAAERFPDKPTSDRVLVFEDAKNGAEAGVAAGMHVIWIPDSRLDQAGLRDKVAQTLTSLEQFKPELFGLPPYDS